MTPDQIYEAQIREDANRTHNPQLLCLLQLLDEARSEYHNTKDALVRHTENWIERENALLTEIARLTAAVHEQLDARANLTIKIARLTDQLHMMKVEYQKAAQVALKYRDEVDAGLHPDTRDPEHALGQGFAANCIAKRIRALANPAPKDKVEIIEVSLEEYENVVAVLNNPSGPHTPAPQETAGSKILAGLQDALAYAKGDTSRARVTRYGSEDGWIPWHGGECPIPDGVKWFEVKFRLGSESGQTTPAELADFEWGHRGGPGDIIAYRVLT